MPVQSFEQQSKYRRNLWIGSRTSMSVIGRSFKMIKELGRFANMKEFANDLLVLPVENSEEKSDMDLEVKDGILAIKCLYSSDTDLCDLSRVWLMGNEILWCPIILDEESDVRVLLCWDGESEFDGANNNDMQEQDERN
eukprot:8265300-Ditylum_brightwellii.AAC.1